MQFLPLLMGPIVSTMVSAVVFVFFVLTYKPNARTGRSPHHRWNMQVDFLAAHERAAFAIQQS